MGRDVRRRDRAEREPTATPRRRTAGSALTAMVVALALGALFNAAAMKKTALDMPFGAARDLRLALVGPLASLSHWSLLDRPAEWTALALGKPRPGPPPARAGSQPAAGQDDEATSGRPDGKPGKTLQERPLPKPYKGHPMRLYIAGDSMMGLPGMALTNLAGKTKLVKTLLDYRISTGLCRPDAFDWPAQLRAQVKAFHPGAVAVMFGANDNQGVETPSGEVYQFGSRGWKKEYRRRVEEVVAVLYRGGVRRVYWIGQPVMPDSSYDAQVRLINEIFRGVAEKTTGVHYIDAYRLLSKGGRYTQYLPDAGGAIVQVREQDGEHLTYAGGLIVAQAVLDAVESEWFPDRGDAHRTPPPASPKPTGAATPEG